MKYKKTKVFISLLVFSLWFSVWLPNAFADDELILSEVEVTEICDIETLEVKEEEEKEEQASEVEEKEEQASEVEETPAKEEASSELEKPKEKTDEKPKEEAEVVLENNEDEEMDHEADEVISNLAENFQVYGFMPIIPVPNMAKSSRSVGILSTGLQDTIAVNKTAQRKYGECRTFEVTLDITGTPQPAPVDVVLIIDKSGSMNESINEYTAITSAPSNNGSYYVKVNGQYVSISRYSGSGTNSIWRYSSGGWRYVRWNANGNDNSAGSTNSNNAVGKPFYTATSRTRLYYAKEAAINFAGNVLNGNPDNRVSLVTFSGPSTVNDNGQQSQAQTVRGLTNNLTQLTNDINGITAGGGTNTQAGFLEGRSVIENSDRPYANKVVIMFTDGLPTASNGVKYEESTDINHPHNQAALAAGKGIFQDGVADVFTIGLLQGMSTTERNLALQILQQTNNKGWYEAPTAADLNAIFDTIASLLGYSATNAKVVDKIGDDFDLVVSSLPSGASYNAATRVITWNPGTIEEHAQLKYKVVAKNGSVGLKDTNEYATLTYTDVFGAPNKTKTFPKPKVDIPTLLEVELSDATIILGDSINLGVGTIAAQENYMNIFGGDGNGTFTYQWRVKGNNTVISTQRNPSVNPTSDTVYEVTVTDSNGCIAKAEMKVFVRKLTLTVEKIIEGNFAEFDKEFNFEITIGDDTFTFQLGHEDTIDFENIGKNTNISLTEESGDYTLSVVVVNGDELTGINGVYSTQILNEDMKIVVTNTRIIDIDTGVIIDNEPYILLLSSAVLGFGLYMSIKRKRKD